MYGRVAGIAVYACNALVDSWPTNNEGVTWRVTSVLEHGSYAFNGKQNAWIRDPPLLHAHMTYLSAQEVLADERVVVGYDDKVWLWLLVGMAHLPPRRLMYCGPGKASAEYCERRFATDRHFVLTRNDRVPSLIKVCIKRDTQSHVSSENPRAEMSLA